jgi:hypothetical protein
MNPIRLRDLEASLRKELSRQVETDRLEPNARVIWLVDQLENYLQRWIGIGASSSQSELPISDELFQMVEVAAEVVSAELKCLQLPAIARNWQELLAVLADARLTYDPAMRQQLAGKLAVVRSTLGS